MIVTTLSDYLLHARDLIGVYDFEGILIGIVSDLLGKFSIIILDIWLFTDDSRFLMMGNIHLKKKDYIYSDSITLVLVSHNFIGFHEVFNSLY